MKTCYQKLRQGIDVRLLEALRRADRPQSVGELFLATGVSHTMINRVLAELREAGVVRSEILTTEGRTCIGTRFRHQALHWSLVPKSLREP